MYANYGFDSKAIDNDKQLDAWQGGLVLSHTNDSGVNKLILRYSDNSDNSVYNKTDDLSTVYASFEGSHKFTEQAQIDYLLAFMITITARTMPTTVKTMVSLCDQCISGTTCTQPGWKPATSV